MESLRAFVERLKLATSHESLVDILPWLRNALLDMSGQLIMGKDMKAGDYEGNSHKIIKSMDKAVDLGNRYLQIRRL